MESTRPSIAQRNAAAGYGLTLVAGLPLPHAITREVLAAQAQIEGMFPGRFIWYRASHLHVTLRALLRTRYRAAPPLNRAELPDDLAGFATGLGDLFAQVVPFSLEIGSAHLDEEGVLLLDVHNGLSARARITSWLQNYPEFDPPKHPQDHLHISVGYLRESSDTHPASQLTETLQSLLYDTCISATVQTQVEQVWLVHYANRTLNRILGKVPLNLGRPNRLTASGLLEALRIADQPTTPAAERKRRT